MGWKWAGQEGGPREDGHQAKSNILILFIFSQMPCTFIVLNQRW